MTDIKRYGTGELAGDYYFVQRSSSVGTQSYLGVSVLFIDDLGGTEEVGTGGEGWSQAEIAELPTMQEAIGQHLEPAFERAEANRKAWLKHRAELPPPPPEPPPISEATRRFFDDDSVALDLTQ